MHAELLGPDGLMSYPNGQVALSGDSLGLYRKLDELLSASAAELGAIEHQFPPIIPARELERVDYLTSFPHLATFPVTLARNEENIARFAENRGTADDLRLSSLSRVADVLTPAACYHFYVAYSGRELSAPLYLTTRGTCFRREQAYRSLERLWSFSMREIVCIGTLEEVEELLASQRRVVGALAERLGLSTKWTHATDPFFRASQSSKHLAQRLDPVKSELTYDDRLAIASVNLHRNYFGEAFSIARDGQPAFSGCVAFGIERWMAVVVSTFGPSADGWPDELTQALTR